MRVHVIWESISTAVLVTLQDMITLQDFVIFGKIFFPDLFPGETWGLFVRAGLAQLTGLTRLFFHLMVS